MADPLTVLGTVASTGQIIGVFTKAVSVLDTLRVQWQTSDIALLSLTSQLGALSAALAKVQEWQDSEAAEVHHQLTMDLDIALNCCKMLATKVYVDISNLQKGPTGSLLTTAKAKFLFKRNGIGELQKMIDRQTATLTLLLTACNSNSLSKQQEILETPGARKSIRCIQKDTESLRSLVDSASFPSRSTEKSSKLSMLFDFDKQLFASRPYTAMIRRRVKLNIRLPDTFAPKPKEAMTDVANGPTKIVTGKLQGTMFGMPSDSTRFTPPTLKSDQEMDQQHALISRKVGGIILLGVEEASKTTFINQMQGIYGSELSTDEKIAWRVIIREGIFSKLGKLRMLLKDDVSHADAIWLDSIGTALYQSDTYDGYSILPEPFKLFAANVSQSVHAEVRSYCLSMHLDYFAKHSERVFHPEYIPTTEDICRSHVQTTGIHRHTFDIPRMGLCDVHDVGGSRSQRKKWLSGISQHPTVLLFIPIGCYDQLRMHEALQITESIMSSLWYAASDIFLCFTQHDLFEKKIESGLFPLTKFYPDYTGSLTDVNACREWITRKFTEKCPQQRRQGVFYIDALNPEHVQDVVESVLGSGDILSPRFHVFDQMTDSSNPSTIGIQYPVIEAAVIPPLDGWSHHYCMEAVLGD